jgi:hypothetical protein
VGIVVVARFFTAFRMTEGGCCTLYMKKSNAVGFQNTSPPLTAEPPLKGKPRNGKAVRIKRNK